MTPILTTTLQEIVLGSREVMWIAKLNSILENAERENIIVFTNAH